MLGTTNLLQKFSHKNYHFLQILGPFVCVTLFNAMLRALVRDFFLTLAVDILSSPERIRCSNEQLSQYTIRLQFFICPSVVLSVRRKLQHFLHLLCNRCTEISRNLTRSKNSRFSTKFVILVPIGQ